MEKDIYNDKKEITANEINKYVYCPYQWYYERVYGSSYLREQKSLLNEDKGYNYNERSAFEKGRKFHKYYKIKEIIATAVKIIILIAVVIGVAYAYFRFF